MKSFDELFALNQAAAGRLQAVAEPAVPALTPAVADPVAPVVAAVTGAAVIPPALRKEGRSLASGWSTQASTVPGRFSYVVNSVHPVPEEKPVQPNYNQEPVEEFDPFISVKSNNNVEYPLSTVGFRLRGNFGYYGYSQYSGYNGYPGSPGYSRYYGYPEFTGFRGYPGYTGYPGFGAIRW
ncbi:uncharacterized protein LOC111699373 isoform X2 [Eurytemora carolleeae]|nr:uncharacterized protein LOC111699373 isoform X2 [Eurytemora carolleeae]|eukprot:XP_023325814.1 uncharacterized protein LOC111699373 isoform X2 [Eurytemora affinis]